MAQHRGGSVIAFLFSLCFVVLAAAPLKRSRLIFSPEFFAVLLPPLLQAKLMRRRVLSSAVEAAPASMQPFTGRVISVQDGDGFTASAGGSPVKIRLYGIDAPEWGQFYARQAWLFLGICLGAGPVYCVPVTRDHYNRLVCDCYGVHPYSVSLMMALHGYAWHMPAYAPEASHIRDAQRLARLNKKGLWRQPNPVTPWHFRHTRHLRRSFSHE